MLRATFVALCRGAHAAGGAAASDATFTSGVPRFAGGCLCGTVQYVVDGPPDWVAVDHSSFYRVSHGAMNVALAGVRPRNLFIEEGEGYLHRKAFDTVYKHTCKKCGTHVYDDWLSHHKKIIFPSQLQCLGKAHRVTADWQALHPQFHLNYNSALLPVYDGLPKFSSLPKQWRGGTGEMLTEDFPEVQTRAYQGDGQGSGSNASDVS
eukprot:TRINITY_DN11216_c0_g1_i1.p1 TRINITY_DN11216_c0_g1~~TRINITY_DN11216_c0_g1_i1.p1  ORF type:complete len:218 (+),score=68.05 TRINITY_DN11216_c0_g1_i1:36-656(+)